MHNAREHNLKNIDVEIPRDQLHRGHRRVGLGQVDARFDILFAEGQRRYLESLNAYARQFVQPATRPDVDAIFGIPPTVAIEQRTSRGGRKSTVGDADRDLPFPAPAVREARHAALPGLRRADRAAERGGDRRARCCASTAASSIALLAPLVVARKGYLHRSREVGRGQGLRAPARRRRVPADREVAAARPLPRAHHRAAGRHDRRVGGERARAPRGGSTRALELGKGVVHVLGLRRAAARRHAHVLDASAPARRAAAASPSSTRGSSRSTRSTAGARHASAPALADRRASTTSRRGEESWWNDVGRRARLTRLPGLRRASASTRTRSPCASAASRSRSSPRSRSRPRRELLRAVSRSRGREGEIARDILAELGSRLAFLQRGRARLSRARSRARRRSRAARRSASASPRSSARTCAASATSSTSRPSACTRATTACCSTRSRACARRATRWSSSSTTRTRSAAPST